MIIKERRVREKIG